MNNWVLTWHVQMEAMRLDQLKDLWKSRSFSFIHEARPKDTTQAFFMQSLYSSALSKNIDASLCLEFLFA